MPRVVRDVIQMTRTIHPPDAVAALPIAPDGGGDTSPTENLSAPEEQSPILIEWQVLILIHVLPDTMLT